MCIVHGCIEEVTAEIKMSVTIRLCLTPVLRSSVGSPGGLNLILYYTGYTRTDAPDEMQLKALGDEMSVRIKAVSKFYVQ